ncbi:uncharacterized protein LOC122654692 [Telopea speciosissima]|uniref:uncharacterized protein LOC122654692 n=1 Tax=Telopea speciosissima TaxID=54955 RepID=UPI001CC39010|nr:uncharacterized protein LOC122654692 [Telopea speciosissima]
MDGFKKNHSSPSTKPSSIPKFSSPDLQPRTSYSKDVGMINENDQSAHQMGSKLQSPKNFMSPTISTASKAASTKKVLGERNEPSRAIISATHVDKSPISNHRSAYTDMGFNDLDRYSSLTPKISSKVSELDQENISAANPSSQPYDPLTNYLSPRPKFLRYRPNRRHEFLLHRENELTTEEKGFKLQGSVEEEDSNQSIDADGSSSSSSGEVSLEQESNPSDDDEDMEEFEVHKRHWDFNKVFKSLLLLGILILSTMYISSMNSPTPPPYNQALQEFREYYQKVQEFVLRTTMVNIAPGSSFLDQEHENSQGVTNRNETVTPEGIQEEEMICSIGMQETGESFDIAIEVLDLQVRENMEVSDNHMRKAGENFYQLAEKLELQQLETDAHSVPDSQTQFMSHWVDNQIASSEPVMVEQWKDEAVTEASGGAANELTLKQEIEAHSVPDSQSQFMSHWMDNQIASSEPVMAEQEKDEAVTEALGEAANELTLKQEIDWWRERVNKWMEEVENISGETNKMFELLDTDDDESSQVSQTQLISGAKAIEYTASDIHNTDGTKVDVEEEDQIKLMKSKFIAMAAVGVSKNYEAFAVEGSVIF